MSINDSQRSWRDANYRLAEKHAMQKEIDRLTAENAELQAQVERYKEMVQEMRSDIRGFSSTPIPEHSKESIVRMLQNQLSILTTLPKENTDET